MPIDMKTLVAKCEARIEKHGAQAQIEIKIARNKLAAAEGNGATLVKMTKDYALVRFFCTKLISVIKGNYNV